MQVRCSSIRVRLFTPLFAILKICVTWCGLVNGLTMPHCTYRWSRSVFGGLAASYHRDVVAVLMVAGATSEAVAEKQEKRN